MKLGIEDTVRISAARQVYGTSKKRYEVEYLAGDLGEIFGLGSPEDDGITTKIEEDVIEVLEAKVEAARNAYLANPSPPVGTCTQPIQFGGSNGTYRWNPAYNNCESCGGCKPESLMKQKEMKEAKEELERQLKDSKLKFESRREEMFVRQQRMTSFKFQYEQ